MGCWNNSICAYSIEYGRTYQHNGAHRDAISCMDWNKGKDSMFRAARLYSQKQPKKFQKMPKSEFWQRSSPHFSNEAKNSPKLLKIGGKVAKICIIFWRKIATSGHSVCVYTTMPLLSGLVDSQEGSAYPDNGLNSLQQRQENTSCPSQPHAVRQKQQQRRLASQHSFGPTGRFGRLRVSDQHRTQKEQSLHFESRG